MERTKSLTQKFFVQKFFWILQRSPILYLLAFLVFYRMVNYQDVIDRARVAALNRLMPSTETMVSFITRNQPLKKEILNDYRGVMKTHS